MMLQSLAAALIVAACAAYAVWTLMPAGARRGIALAVLKLPLPAALAGFMRRHAVPASGCGCDGCDQSALKAPRPGAQTIRIHRRLPKA
ncbi:MAG: hypothetical protein ABI699_12210 [Caldimonas sp.]